MAPTVAVSDWGDVIIVAVAVAVMVAVAVAVAFTVAVAVVFSEGSCYYGDHCGGEVGGR